MLGVAVLATVETASALYREVSQLLPDTGVEEETLQTNEVAV